MAKRKRINISYVIQLLKNVKISALKAKSRELLFL